LFIDPETGRSKGFGFIQYKNSEDAKQALEKMNGFELAGRSVNINCTHFFYTVLTNIYICISVKGGSSN
jgi:hypothetical protein